MTQNMLFISYSTFDLTIVQAIINKFALDSMSVWIDHKNLDLEHPIADQIEAAIADSSTFLLFDSRNARQSRWVQFELDMQSKMAVPLTVFSIYR